jgi:hypothetical protein
MLCPLCRLYLVFIYREEKLETYLLGLWVRTLRGALRGGRGSGNGSWISSGFDELRGAWEKLG